VVIEEADGVVRTRRRRRRSSVAVVVVVVVVDVQRELVGRRRRA